MGPVIGAVTLLVLEEALSRVTEYWPIILGPLILLVVLYRARRHRRAAREARPWLSRSCASRG